MKQFSSSQLGAGDDKTFSIAHDDAEQRRAGFRVSGCSPGLSIIYTSDEQQQFNGRDAEVSTWEQRNATTPEEVSFVILIVEASFGSVTPAEAAPFPFYTGFRLDL